MIKAIQTRYDDYYFRSRQEARFAVWLNALNIPYRYEHQGFDLGNGVFYLPDFYLSSLEIWVEIKGKAPSPGEINKAALLSQQQADPVHITWSNFSEETKHDTLTFWKDTNGICRSTGGLWFDIDGAEAANAEARSARF